MAGISVSSFANQLHPSCILMMVPGIFWDFCLSAPNCRQLSGIKGGAADLAVFDGFIQILCVHLHLIFGSFGRSEPNAVDFGVKLYKPLKIRKTPVVERYLGFWMSAVCQFGVFAASGRNG